MMFLGSRPVPANFRMAQDLLRNRLAHARVATLNVIEAPIFTRISIEIYELGLP